MAAKTTEFFGSDARLKIKGISGVNLSVKLSKELAELFGISLMEMKDGGFNAPIIKALSPGIPWTTNEKKMKLAYFCYFRVWDYWIISNLPFSFCIWTYLCYFDIFVSAINIILSHSLSKGRTFSSKNININTYQS